MFTSRDYHILLSIVYNATLGVAYTTINWREQHKYISLPDS